MPELPEVETTRLTLLPALEGQRIARAELMRADLRFPFPPLFEERVEGLKILGIRRRAKYLLFDLEGGQVMLAHLGMSGSFLLADATHTLRKHDHVRFTLGNGQVLLFHDPRRFGIIDLIKQDDEASHALLAHLGPEPLSEAFSSTYLSAALARRKGPVKPTLMDQQLVVGVGNIYASESLFAAGIHPASAAHEVAHRAQDIIEAVRASLNAALKSGGSTLRDFTGADGKMGYFQHAFKVYEREGEPCFSCGRDIECLVQAGRSTYFCAHCQTAAANKSGRRKKLHGEKAKNRAS